MLALRACPYLAAVPLTPPLTLTLAKPTRCRAATARRVRALASGSRLHRSEMGRAALDWWPPRCRGVTNAKSLTLVATPREDRMTPVKRSPARRQVRKNPRRRGIFPDAPTHGSAAASDAVAACRCRTSRFRRRPSPVRRLAHPAILSLRRRHATCVNGRTSAVDPRSNKETVALAVAAATNRRTP